MIKKKKKPTEEQARQAVRTLISWIGDDPDRAGLLDTPKRVLKAWKKEWGAGYRRSYIRIQRASILKGQFNDGAERVNEMVAVTGIQFHSFCEHHLAVFNGQVSIAYIPNGKILGLSKLARVVDLFSKRLQVQERLTNQIADFINKECCPIGVGVVIRASHSCIGSRGVHQPGVEAVTSALRGEMYTRPEVRQEFLKLVGR